MMQSHISVDTHKKKNEEAEYVNNIAKYQDQIYAYIYSILPNSFAADDILQETNIVLWKKINFFEPNTNFIGWAYRIAYYQTKLYILRRKRLKWTTFNEKEMGMISETFIENNDLLEDQYNALENCINNLSDTDRKILSERYINNFSLKMISEKLSRSVGALKQVFLRIRGTLKKCIETSISEGKYSI